MQYFILPFLSVLLAIPVLAEGNPYGLKETVERHVKGQPAPKGLLEQSVDKYMSPMTEKQKQLSQKQVQVVDEADLQKRLKRMDKKFKESTLDVNAANKAYRDLVRAQLPKQVCKNGKLAPDAILAFRENLGLDMDRNAKIFYPVGHYDYDGEPPVFFTDSLKMAAAGCNDFSFIADLDTFHADDIGLLNKSGLDRSQPVLVQQTCQMTEAGFTKDSALSIRCKCQMKMTDVKSKQYTYESGDRFLLDADMGNYRHRENFESYDIAYDFCATTPEDQKTSAYKRAYKAQESDVKERIALLQQKADSAAEQRRTTSLEVEDRFENHERYEREKKAQQEQEKELKCQKWREDVKETFGFEPKSTDCGKTHMSRAKAFGLLVKHCGLIRYGGVFFVQDFPSIFPRHFYKCHDGSIMVELTNTTGWDHYKCTAGVAAKMTRGWSECQAVLSTGISSD